MRIEKLNPQFDAEAARRRGETGPHTGAGRCDDCNRSAVLCIRAARAELRLCARCAVHLSDRAADRFSGLARD
jgi:hypothetical protein